MGSYGYFVVLGLIVVGGFVTVSELAGDRKGNSELLDIYVREEARNAAVTGLNVTIDRLMEDEGPWLDPTAYQVSGTPHNNSSYASAVVPVGSGDTVDVTSIGSHEYRDPNGVRSEIRHTIRVMLVRDPDEGPLIADWSEH